MDLGQVKQLVQKLEPVEKSSEKLGKMIQPESFRRLQEKVKGHGELLTKIKNMDP